jgi:uncharacterized protein
MSVAPPEKVEIRAAGAKGRGVFARVPIRKGEVIERCPVIELDRDTGMFINGLVLGEYVYQWDGKDGESGVAVALGYGSLYNHSYTPNAVYEQREREKLLVIRALRDIPAGEEVQVNYNGQSSDSANEPMWFNVV